MVPKLFIGSSSRDAFRYVIDDPPLQLILSSTVLASSRLARIVKSRARHTFKARIQVHLLASMALCSGVRSMQAFKAGAARISRAAPPHSIKIDFRRNVSAQAAQTPEELQQQMAKAMQVCPPCSLVSVERRHSS